MAKAIFNPETTFKNLIAQGGVGKSEPPLKNDDNSERGKRTLPKKPETGEKIAAATSSRVDPKEPKKKLDSITRKTFYITKQQYRDLRVRAAISDSLEEKDTSMIVRAALDLYFKQVAPPA